MFPVSPFGPCSPVFPVGTVKFKITLLDVPEFVTEADDPAAPVVVLPTEIVAAASPLSPFGP